MNNKWTDSHFHADDFVSEAILPELMAECDAQGVGILIAIGGEDAANQTARDVARRYPGRVFATAGYDRGLAGKVSDIQAVDALLGDPAIVGVGETGLDYHYNADTRLQQMELFEGMLGLSAARQKPVVIHSREADEDTLTLLQAHRQAWKGNGPPGVLHCFTGGRDFAFRLLDLGYLISFSGIVTFRNADSLREVARALPGESILVETDAPYLAPVPRRSHRNQPAWVAYTGRFLAELRGEEEARFAVQTTANAARLFQWPLLET